VALKDRFQKLAKGEARLRFDPLANDEARFANLRIEQVQPDEQQPRKNLGELGELKESIKVHGILQPIVVAPVEDGEQEGGADVYRIISGERRYTAARELGLATVPAIVRTVKDAQRLELQIIENLHRKDLHPLEEAMSYRRLIDDFELTQREAAERVGKSLAYLNQSLRLLDLSEEAWEEVGDTERISKSVLLEIVKQPREEHGRLIREAAGGDLTVRKARRTKGGGGQERAEPAGTSSSGRGGGESAEPRKERADYARRFTARTGTVIIEPKARRELNTAELVELLTKALEKVLNDNP
jgi:ParB family chromosome partitioning protein